MEIAGAKPTGAAGELMGGLTEYEIQRAAHIRRNMEYMQRLGLLDSAKELADQDPPEKVKRVKKPKTVRADAHSLAVPSRLRDRSSLLRLLVAPIRRAACRRVLSRPFPPRADLAIFCSGGSGRRETPVLEATGREGGDA